MLGQTKLEEQEGVGQTQREEEEEATGEEEEEWQGQKKKSGIDWPGFDCLSRRNSSRLASHSGIH